MIIIEKVNFVSNRFCIIPFIYFIQYSSKCLILFPRCYRRYPLKEMINLCMSDEVGIVAT